MFDARTSNAEGRCPNERSMGCERRMRYKPTKKVFETKEMAMNKISKRV